MPIEGHASLLALWKVWEDLWPPLSPPPSRRPAVATRKVARPEARVVGLLLVRGGAGKFTPMLWGHRGLDRPAGALGHFSVCGFGRFP
jgi:hypothetical protein